MRVAAIDCGTNSFHLLVAEVDPTGRLTMIERARVQVMLGSGGIAQHRIAPDAFARGVEAMKSFKQVADSLGVIDIHAAATSAVREANNGAKFCDAVKLATGIHVRVISGHVEGRLIWLGARGVLDFRRGPVLLFDVGGGSTEFVLCDGADARHIQSLPLGHIRAAETHPLGATTDEDASRALRRSIRRDLEPLLRRVRPSDVGAIVGTSGTVRTLARMCMLQAGLVPPEHDQGLVLQRKELEKLIERMRLGDGFASLPGLDSRRQRTIGAGAVIVREILRAFDVDKLTTSERSLRDGLVVDWMLRHRPELDLEGSVADPRERAVLLILRRFGADEEHGRHVARLADTLFDATASLHQLPVADRGLLHAAAMLHDIGHHIADESHHKHGQYLLKYVPMPGFTAPEIAILSNVVRYHSRSQPKLSHPDWTQLNKVDQDRVRVLAGILKVADAFDRSHTQAVSDIAVLVGRKRVQIDALTAEGADLERWEAERRTELLARALGREIRIGMRPALAEARDAG